MRKLVTLTIITVVIITWDRRRPMLEDMRFAETKAHWRRMCTVAELMCLAGNKPVERKRRKA